jgi:hypothetical protein
MSRGAYQAGTPLRSSADNGEATDEAEDYFSLPNFDDAPEKPPAPKASIGERVLFGLFGLFAFVWVAAIAGLAMSAIGTRPVDLVTILRGVSMASGPLALIAVLLLLWQRNSSGELRRYGDVARGVRMETLALDAVLSLASKRLAEDRAAVAEQADALLTLADETSARLNGVTAALAREITNLGRQNGDLDAAAGNARVDMGVLLADLPLAEERTRALAESIRAAGADAHGQTAALGATLDALAARAQEAEDGTAAAASRLSTQVSQIAGASQTAARGIDAAGQQMAGSIDAMLNRAADAVERARHGIAAQGEAVDTMIERARATAEAAAAQAAQALEARVSAIGGEVAAISTSLAAQDSQGAAMIERIQRGLASLDARFAELDETGRARTERLAEALGALSSSTERTMASLNEGGTAATTLINRAETLKTAIRACLIELGEDLPIALGHLEKQAARSQEAATASAPEVARLGEIATNAAETLNMARGALDLQRQSIEALGEAISTRMAAAKADADALGEAVADADAKSVKLADDTSPRLVEALIRVRETAGHAAGRAREALATIIPGSAEALGDAGRKALESAIGDQVEGQIARVSALSREAAEAAEAAAHRLEQQLARVAETSASVEDHIAAGKAQVEASDRDNFSRRVALLIDSLNSTSIDVAKLLSSETSDAAWQAYLKGDRGVFTRRAVRLLDNGEAREIARHYGEAPEFRDQVNHYLHDFEALLRPILATREGSTLAVIMLSSEMGKLYVALAQAIERLRA